MASGKKRKGLGSMGVDVLLSSTQSPLHENYGENVSKKQSGSPEATGLRNIPIDLIDTSPFQPRVKFDQEQLQILSDSIKSQGVIQPIVVRKKNERFELIAGERRWRAAQLAGYTELPAVIKEVDDTGAAAMALVENIQREDLSPIEEANAMAKLIEQFNWTHQQVAEAVGKARATVSNAIRLLDLNEQVKQFISAKSLEMGHARALLALPYERQPAAAMHIIEKNLTVRATEQYIRNLLRNGNEKARQRTPTKDANIARLEQTLGEQLAAPVEIQHSSASGKGVLKIRYSGLEELEGILKHITSEKGF